VPVVPPANFARLVWSELAPERRRALEAAGASEALLDEAWASHAVLRHRPRVAKENRLIVAAAADRLCTPAHARELWEHWDRPELHWYPGSHLVPIGRGGVRLRIANFLHQRLNDAPAPPAPAPSEPPQLSRFRLHGREGV
jgi:hypothetical protein